jgi:hypothetical protein
MTEGNQAYQSLSHFHRECKYYVGFIPQKITESLIWEDPKSEAESGKLNSAFASFQSLLGIHEFPKKPPILISIKLKILAIYKICWPSHLSALQENKFLPRRVFSSLFPALEIPHPWANE